MKLNQKNKKIIFAVVDTNVLISALLSKDGLSNPAIIIREVVRGSIKAITNRRILEEYEAVINRPKFKFPKEIVAPILEILKKDSLKLEPTKINIEFNFPDSTDIVFYEVKMSKKGSFLITGNKKHFPNEPEVVTPTEMVEILKNNKIIK